MLEVLGGGDLWAIPFLLLLLPISLLLLVLLLLLSFLGENSMFFSVICSSLVVSVIDSISARGGREGRKN